MAGLSVDRRVTAPPEAVWRAFTEPAQLSEWYWPASFAAVATLDARVGGELRIHSETVGIGVSGVVAEVDAGRRLATTWLWDGETEETAVTLVFAPDGAGTRLTVRHDGFASDASVADHVRGWNDCLARLATYLDG